MHTRSTAAVPVPVGTSDKSLSPKRTKANSGNAVLSPNCVAAVADLALSPPPMELSDANKGPKTQKECALQRALKHKACSKKQAAESPKQAKDNIPPPPPLPSTPVEDLKPVTDGNPFESVRHAKRGGDEDNLPHACWWARLMALTGDELIDRLRQVQLDEMIDYHGGVLNARFVEKIVRLYDHVNQQGDDVKGIYSAPNADNELPYLCPGADESGFTRLERLEMAAEYDIWQWYLVTGENYSLLDTLVWMGIQMKKLWSRPVTPQ